ncbi:hypothetical protein NQ314_010092 [Rhamnusium bicolor]|uniref:Uncharacterized protein n=1 Tax=Rhamnusium bicolor TaxID=1586634 RepID=A0AAV8XVQ0_9CUCU|nr:hypothetical protein NQ314_010092 [Rhamnusium bicolor]
MSVSYSPLRNRVQANNLIERTDVSINIKPKHNTDISATPLMNTAPMAKSEIDDDIDDREVITTPYPGIDDGFFNDTSKNKDEQPDVETIDPKRPKRPGPDVEIFPTKPRDPEPLEPPDEIPTINPRIDPDGENNPDDIDGKNGDPVRPFSPQPHKPFFPYDPGFGRDPEIGSIPGDFPESSIPDVNIYQHKKTLAQGMMDLALFSANANQLRYVLESFNRHPYFFPSIILISISLILQVSIIWYLFNLKIRFITICPVFNQ